MNTLKYKGYIGYVDYSVYVFENYSHRQIAELLSIKESTSASQLYYAKQWLARRIKKMKE